MKPDAGANSFLETAKKVAARPSSYLIKHTRGPWRDLGTAIGPAYQGQGGESDQLLPVAFLPNPKGWDMEEWKANARLIAAAPELLMVCLAFQARRNGGYTAEHYSILDEAISKARGKP